MVEERENLRRDIESAERAVAARSAQVSDIDKVLHQVLDLAEPAGAVYALGSPTVRRRFQAIFERIEVGIDGLVVQTEVRKPFSAVVEQEIKRRQEEPTCKRSNDSQGSDWTVFRSTSSRKFSLVRDTGRRTPAVMLGASSCA